MLEHGDHARRAAWRRRQRRQRSWLSTRAAERGDGPVRSRPPQLRYKVAADAKCSGQRAQKSDRAEAANEAPQRQTPSAARGPELFQLYEEEPGRGSPNISAWGGWPGGPAADRRVFRACADSRCPCGLGCDRWGARPNLATCRGASFHGRHGAGGRSAQDICLARPPRAVPSSSKMVEPLVEVPGMSPTECVLSAPVPQMGVNWWKCRKSCLSQSSSSFLSSRPFTFQFVVVLDRAQQRGRCER